jgi:hypothetical protein
LVGCVLGFLVCCHRCRLLSQIRREVVVVVCMLCGLCWVGTIL